MEEIKKRILETLRAKMEANGDGFLPAASVYAQFRQFELLEKIEIHLSVIVKNLSNIEDQLQEIDATLMADKDDDD